MVCLQFVSRHDFAPMWPGPRSERSPWLHSPGSSHQVCFNPAAHRKQFRAAISYAAISVAMTQEVHLYRDEESVSVFFLKNFEDK